VHRIWALACALGGPDGTRGAQTARSALEPTGFLCLGELPSLSWVGNKANHTRPPIYGVMPDELGTEETSA